MNNNIEFFLWDSEDFYSKNRNAMIYWFIEQHFTRLIIHLYGEREFYIRESFDFFNINTQEIKDENGNNLFDRNLYEDFDDILLIDRKYFRVVKSDKSNKVTTIIVYELIPQINYSTKINP